MSVVESSRRAMSIASTFRMHVVKDSAASGTRVKSTQCSCLVTSRRMTAMLRAPQGNDGRVLRDVGEIAFPQRDIVNAIGFRLERGMRFLEHALGTRVAGVLPHAAKR